VGGIGDISLLRVLDVTLWMHCTHEDGAHYAPRSGKSDD
jgi:hypothetical protein